MANKSKMGYRDDSPYRNEPFIDINTPNGVIDMSETGIPLMANGRVLPPYSGMHQFDSNVVREEPMHQMPDGSWMPGATHDDDEYEYLELTDEEAAEYRFGGMILEDLTVLQDGGSVLGLGAGPLKEQNPYLVPEYNQPMDGNIILPDVNRPQLEGTNATEYKIGVGFDDGNVTIPTVIGGQYVGVDGAIDRYKSTGERFKEMDNPSSYSRFYDTVEPLNLMKKQNGGESTSVKKGLVPDFSNPQFYENRHPFGIPLPKKDTSGKLKETAEQPLIEKAYDVLSNPLTALANSRNGIPDNLGQAVKTGNLDRNALEMASDVINPIAYANLVIDTYNEIDNGNYGVATLNAASMLPGLGVAGKYAKKFKSAKKIENTPTPILPRKGTIHAIPSQKVLKKELEPYLSKRLYEPTAEEKVFNSFLSPEKRAAYNADRTINYDRYGNVLGNKKNLENKQDGGEVELSEEEAEQMRAQGYIVEEI